MLLLVYFHYLFVVLFEFQSPTLLRLELETQLLNNFIFLVVLPSHSGKLLLESVLVSAELVYAFFEGENFLLKCGHFRWRHHLHCFHWGTTLFGGGQWFVVESGLLD